jgi:hypothetical protein
LVKADGSIKAWGYGSEGTDAPAGNGYTKIYSNGYAFAALKANGSIVGAPVLPEYELPHVVIEPSALRAAKACEFE